MIQDRVIAWVNTSALVEWIGPSETEGRVNVKLMFQPSAIEVEGSVDDVVYLLKDNDREEGYNGSFDIRRNHREGED